MAFTFKLGNPTDQVKADVCRVPEWLDVLLASVSIKFNKSELGNVDISLIRGESFDYNEKCVQFGDYYQELICPVESNSNKNDNTSIEISERPIHPKVFCDEMYMRMMSILFTVSGEEQASSVQTDIENLLEKFEKKFLYPLQ